MQSLLSMESSSLLTLLCVVSSGSFYLLYPTLCTRFNQWRMQRFLRKHPSAMLATDCPAVTPLKHKKTPQHTNTFRNNTAKPNEWIDTWKPRLNQFLRQFLQSVGRLAVRSVALVVTILRMVLRGIGWLWGTLASIISNTKKKSTVPSSNTTSTNTTTAGFQTPSPPAARTSIRMNTPSISVHGGTEHGIHQVTATTTPAVPRQQQPTSVLKKRGEPKRSVSRVAFSEHSNGDIRKNVYLYNPKTQPSQHHPQTSYASPPETLHRSTQQRAPTPYHVNKENAATHIAPMPFVSRYPRSPGLKEMRAAVGPISAAMRKRSAQQSFHDTTKRARPSNRRVALHGTTAPMASRLVSAQPRKRRSSAPIWQEFQQPKVTKTTEPGNAAVTNGASSATSNTANSKNAANDPSGGAIKPPVFTTNGPAQTPQGSSGFTFGGTAAAATQAQPDTAQTRPPFDGTNSTATTNKISFGAPPSKAASHPPAPTTTASAAAAAQPAQKTSGFAFGATNNAPSGSMPQPAAAQTQGGFDSSENASARQPAAAEPAQAFPFGANSTQAAAPTAAIPQTQPQGGSFAFGATNNNPSAPQPAAAHPPGLGTVKPTTTPQVPVPQFGSTPTTATTQPAFAFGSTPAKTPAPGPVSSSFGSAAPASFGASPATPGVGSAAPAFGASATPGMAAAGNSARARRMKARARGRR